MRHARGPTLAYSELLGLEGVVRTAVSRVCTCMAHSYYHGLKVPNRAQNNNPLLCMAPEGALGGVYPLGGLCEGRIVPAAVAEWRVDRGRRHSGRLELLGLGKLATYQQTNTILLHRLPMRALFPHTES